MIYVLNLGSGCKKCSVQEKGHTECTNICVRRHRHYKIYMSSTSFAWILEGARQVHFEV